MKLAGLVLTLLGAGPAVALDCMPPDPLTSLTSAQAASSRWAVLLGQLQHDGAYPVSDVQEGGVRPNLPPVVARFSGAVLTGSGFDQPYDGPVIMQPVCFGPWCGSFPAPGDAMIFVQVQGDGSYLLPLDPCAQSLFPPPDPAMTAALTACVAGQGCRGP